MYFIRLVSSDIYICLTFNFVRLRKASVGILRIFYWPN